MLEVHLTSVVKMEVHLTSVVKMEPTPIQEGTEVNPGWNQSQLEELQERVAAKTMPSK